MLMMIIIYIFALLGVLSPIMLILFIWDRNRVLRRVKEMEEQIETVSPYWATIKEKLEKELHDSSQSSQIRIAEILPIVEERAKLEAENPNPITEITLVGIKEEKK